MIRPFVAAGLLLMLAACDMLPAQPHTQGSRKPAPAGPPPPSMPDGPLVCPTDIKLCPDGRTVNRSPDRECEFDACAGDPSH